LNVITLTAVMPSIVMLIVVAPGESYSLLLSYNLCEASMEVIKIRNADSDKFNATIFYQLLFL